MRLFFSKCGSNTIFEVESRLDGNLENRVRLVGVKPVFMKYAVDGMQEQRQVFLEVEELLDHLFRLIYTPAHVTDRVIPPFVASNPLPSYIKFVEDAFRIKTYDGKTYSGSYGDLGVTIAAILLHPEARSSGVFRNSIPYQFATFCFHPFANGPESQATSYSRWTENL